MATNSIKGIPKEDLWEIGAGVDHNELPRFSLIEVTKRGKITKQRNVFLAGIVHSLNSTYSYGVDDEDICTEFVALLVPEEDVGDTMDYPLDTYGTEWILKYPSE